MRNIEVLSKLLSESTLEIIEIIYNNKDISQKEILLKLNKLTSGRVCQIVKFLYEYKFIQKEKVGRRSKINISEQNYTEIKNIQSIINKII